MVTLQHRLEKKKVEGCAKTHSWAVGIINSRVRNLCLLDLNIAAEGGVGRAASSRPLSAPVFLPHSQPQLRTPRRMPPNPHPSLGAEAPRGQPTSLGSGTRERLVPGFRQLKTQPSQRRRAQLQTSETCTNPWRERRGYGDIFYGREAVPRRTHLVCSRDRENVSDPFKRKLGRIITSLPSPHTTPTPRKKYPSRPVGPTISGKAVRAGFSPTPLNSQSPSNRPPRLAEPTCAPRAPQLSLPLSRLG